MPKPPTDSMPAQFIILTHKVHGHIDAASLFEAVPADAWKVADKLAVLTRSPYRLCTIKIGKRGALEITQLKRPGKK